MVTRVKINGLSLANTMAHRPINYTLFQSITLKSDANFLQFNGTVRVSSVQSTTLGKLYIVYMVLLELVVYSLLH